MNTMMSWIVVPIKVSGNQLKFEKVMPYSRRLSTVCSLLIQWVGTLQGFFNLHGRASAIANILSLAICEGRFERIDNRKGEWYRGYMEKVGNLREYLA